MREEPSPEQLQAVEDFRRKYSDPARLQRIGCDDWKDALRQAWWGGWDEKEPGSAYLRQLRNDITTGFEWLANYNPPKGT